MKNMFTLPNVIAAASGVGGVAATLKWMVDNIGGEPVPPQAILYYVPFAVISVYVVLCVAALGAGIANSMFAAGKDSEPALVAGLIIGGIVGLAPAFIILLNATEFYQEVSPGARTGGALVGFLILTGTIVVYRHLTKQKPLS